MKKITVLLAIAFLAVSCASNDMKDKKSPFDGLALKEVLLEGSSKNNVRVYSKNKNGSVRNDM